MMGMPKWTQMVAVALAAVVGLVPASAQAGRVLPAGEEVLR
ncbi:MAG: hypothetical protein BIP78_0203 [Candidatus Bipolaricaulis sibiricus]|uniref:Uncharacterized protein n=1 Tax=Bipolaricaulis sibiricus TaxID=2501609 RepID=A0A410FSM5_BIPS1|nr:MAG: hypothetical protein BIP78_0203 [Candidatus Bipolaricaulis sibiricus]